MIQIIMLVLGLIMIFFPQTILKKDYRNDSNRIKKMKQNGVYVTIVIIAWIGIGFL